MAHSAISGAILHLPDNRANASQIAPNKCAIGCAIARSGQA